MPSKTWVLADAEHGIFVDHCALGAGELGLPNCSVVKRTLQVGVRREVDIIEASSTKVHCVIVPTRGMGIWRAESNGVPLRWKSPVHGPVHPSMVRLWEPSGIGWLDGFDEFFVRCGLESNGAPEFHPNGTLRYPLHGRIANTPAHRVEIQADSDTGRLTVSGVVDEARLFGNKLRLTAAITIQPDSPVIEVSDVVSNLSAIDSELELLYHVNLGVPLLSPGAKVLLPLDRLCPRDEVAEGNLPEWDLYGPETPGAPEAVFFCSLRGDAEGRTQAMLKSADGQRACRLHFNRRQLPFFTLWKNRLPVEDGYVTGLEPCINFPNPRSFEHSRGRVDALSPGDSRVFEIRIEGLAGAESVDAAAAEIAALQGDLPPEIVRSPDPDWSA